VSYELWKSCRELYVVEKLEDVWLKQLLNLPSLSISLKQLCVISLFSPILKSQKPKTRPKVQKDSASEKATSSCAYLVGFLFFWQQKRFSKAEPNTSSYRSVLICAQIISIDL